MYNSSSVENYKQADKFPRIMRHNTYNFLVLFSADSRGIVIVNKDDKCLDHFMVGHYSDSWQMSAFREWIGKITLEV